MKTADDTVSTDDAGPFTGGRAHPVAQGVCVGEGLLELEQSFLLGQGKGEVRREGEKEEEEEEEEAAEAAAAANSDHCRNGTTMRAAVADRRKREEECVVVVVIMKLGVILGGVGRTCVALRMWEW